MPAKPAMQTPEEPTVRSRVMADLEELRTDTKRRADMALDKDFTPLGKLLIEINTRILEFGEAGEKRETALDEFSRKLRERQGA